MNNIRWYRAQFVIAAALIGLGTSKGLAQLFLGTWEAQSAGHSDIAARGIWLLAMFLPWITAVAALASVALITVLTWRTPRPLPERLFLGLVGSLAGALLVYFGLDPTGFLLRLVPWGSSLAYYIVSLCVAVAVTLAGITIALRARREFASQPAAA